MNKQIIHKICISYVQIDDIYYLLIRVTHRLNVRVVGYVNIKRSTKRKLKISFINVLIYVSRLVLIQVIQIGWDL